MGSGSERLGARLPQPHEARPPAFLRQAPRLYSGGSHRSAARRRSPSRKRAFLVIKHSKSREQREHTFPKSSAGHGAGPRRRRAHTLQYVLSGQKWTNYTLVKT